MFENDFPLLSAASLTALIIHKAGSGPVTLESCETALDTLFQQASEAPGLPTAERRSRLAGHLADLETACILEPLGPGLWQLTRRGRRALEQHPEGLDQTDLARYPEFATNLRLTAHKPCGMDPRGARFDEGFRAGMTGQPITANPHAFDTADHQAWESGWSEAQGDHQD
ncbi:hypothetical protein K3725_09005 [Leisingera sp. S132]|uniref:ribosome modulation factor n=1 Tax=Leisingera sp. S132 TaxID=2867016 RepID=UPI0021A6DC82|nr:hypothetical protein [Leisingera sp. S132]UWQ81116.1 hypothetical protein K3725_09005 [Leisingera sp. S132]